MSTCDETIRASEFSDAKMHVKDVENVSILGVGDQGELDGVGLSLRSAHNIVIRNLTIHHVDTGEKDGITVQKNSTNIWIDHNEFSNEYPDVDKDYYDGLIDIKDGAAYITVSWNYLHDSWKTMLTGGGDSESSTGDKITYMNNWFQNVNSRVPLVRRSDVHVLNNFFEDSPHEHLESTTDFTVPYDYMSSTSTARSGRPSRVAVMAITGKSQPHTVSHAQWSRTSSRVAAMIAGSMSGVGGTTPRAHSIEGWSSRRRKGSVAIAW